MYFSVLALNSSDDSNSAVVSLKKVSLMSYGMFLYTFFTFCLCL